MNILNEALDVFGDSVIKVHEFIFDQTDHNDFWAFIKKQNKKGVYIFLDMSAEEPKNIIYIGKAGKLEFSERTLSDRSGNYFYKPSEKYPKNHINAGKIIMLNTPINKDGDVEFKKFNAKIDSNDLILKKKDFKMVTIQIINHETISPELLESYLLNTLLKEHKHYPKFNHKI